MPYATAFGGTNEYITFGDAVPLRFERTNSFSIALWARWTSNTVMILAGKMGDLTANRGYDVHTLVGGRWGINLNNDFVGGNWLGLRGQTVVNNGAWHHLAFCYGGGSNAASCDLYTDAVLETKTIFSDTLSATILSPGTAFLVGARLEPGIALPLTADADQLVVANVKWNASQVLDLFNKGPGPGLSIVFGCDMGECATFPTYPDMSLNGNNGTATNMESGDIFVRDPFGDFTTTAPTITNISPTPGSPIQRLQTWSFDVTDDFGLAAVGVSVRLPGRPTEKVYGVFGFEHGYGSSIRTVISGGYHFTITRDGGWPGPPTFYAEALDFRGNLNA